MTVDTITIDRRFRGPVASGNGGVSAGIAASLLGAPATVRLRTPPPLDTPLQVHRQNGVVTISDGDQVTLEARHGRHASEPPVDGDILRRVYARGTVPVPELYGAPECFVCGPRNDGLRICPAPVADTRVWATVWVPGEDVPASDGEVEEHIVWGALDCPAGLAVMGFGVREPTYFPAVTNLTADIRSPIEVGRPVAVFGWPIDEDDRRVNGGSALIDADGNVLASAYAQHARMPLSFGTGADDPSGGQTP